MMKLTQEEKRIKIAEACGWKPPYHEDSAKLQKGWSSEGKWWLNPQGFQKLGHDIPGYFNDLNAMHEAEKVITGTDQLEERYWQSLGGDFNDSGWLGAHCMITATAAQRAEAFGLTLNLWKAGQ